MANLKVVWVSYGTPEPCGWGSFVSSRASAYPWCQPCIFEGDITLYNNVVTGYFVLILHHSIIQSAHSSAKTCSVVQFSRVIFNSRHAAVVISGTELARQIQREIQRDVEELVAQGNMRPHLGVVLVGDDPASRTYVKNKTRAASILGKSRAPSPSCACVHCPHRKNRP